jgi:hypothetical protein
VEELENERNQYEWELKATKVTGSRRHPRRVRGGAPAGRGFALRLPYNRSVEVQTSPTQWHLGCSAVLL